MRNHGLHALLARLLLESQKHSKRPLMRLRSPQRSPRKQANQIFSKKLAACPMYFINVFTLRQSCQTEETANQTWIQAESNASSNVWHEL